MRLYGKIIYELQRVYYRSYRRTDYTLNSLLHCYAFAPCALGGIWCWTSALCNSIGIKHGFPCIHICRVPFCDEKTTTTTKKKKKKKKQIRKSLEKILTFGDWISAKKARSRHVFWLRRFQGIGNVAFDGFRFATLNFLVKTWIFARSNMTVNTVRHSFLCNYNYHLDAKRLRTGARILSLKYFEWITYLSSENKIILE